MSNQVANKLPDYQNKTLFFFFLEYIATVAAAIYLPFLSSGFPEWFQFQPDGVATNTAPAN